MIFASLLRRTFVAAAYLWFLMGATIHFAERVLIHLWMRLRAAPKRKKKAARPRLLRRALAAFAKVPRWLWSWMRKVMAACARQIRYAQKVVHALDRIATTRVFDILAVKPNVREYLDDIVKRLHRTTGDPVTISCAVGLAAKCEAADVSAALARQLVTNHPDEFALQHHAGVQAFIAGDYATAETLWDSCNRGRERLIREAGLDRLNLRFVGPSWVIAIGHIAHLDSYFKWRELKGRHEKLVLAAPVGFRIPNQDLLGRWDHFFLPELPLIPGLTLRDVEVLQDEFWSLEGPDGHWHMYSHAGAWVQSEWERQKRKPLLSLSPDDWARGQEQLAKLGVPEGAWYVCLHVRESGFHQAWHKHHPATRNADISTYVEAIRAITERGGYVIRMGDASMRPLEPMPNLIEYARSESKSEFMDVFLCASCKFFIGTNSGLGLVPPIFGVPCALTNWSPIALPQWYPNDLFIPKLCRSEPLGRLLTFEEMFQSQAGWGQFAEYFERERIELLDNSPEDLRDLVEEMLERESGELHDSEEDERLFSSYRDLALTTGSYSGARIGRRFLRKYAHLLAGRAGPRAPAYRAAPMYAEG
jgi:putative glycosyltransferase (TIGR04372 family)